MTRATKDQILAALEQACRKEAERWANIMTHVECDEQAARYGALTPYIARLAGEFVDYGSVRRALHAEVKAGRVLLHHPYPSTIRWWPVGLWEKLQAERAAEGGAAC